MVDGLDGAAFTRHLEQGFLKGLNDVYDGDNRWWRNLADDPDIFIAIRGGYLNAYYKGSSLLRLSQKGGGLCGDIHYKYLLKPERKPEYVSVVDGTPAIRSHEDFFLTDLSDVGSLKKAADLYAGTEKAGVHDIIKKNPNIVDVEIAFGSEKGDDGKSTVPRLDFAALQETADGIRLVFFEAKHFSNGGLRAKNGQPAVLTQIERYGGLLNRHAATVLESYQQMFSSLLCMKGANVRNPARDRLMQMVASGEKPLELDPDPRLVVFGFDADQKAGPYWSVHLQKLKDALGTRFLAKGDTKGFTSGISDGFI